MRIVYFTHSLMSCWNHGNAHFQRGLLRELQALGHDVTAAEPSESWSRSNLVADQGGEPIARFRHLFPELRVHLYDGAREAEPLVASADAVVVHEWTEPAVVAALGRLRKRGARFQLLFHDTHHRVVSAPHEIARFDLSGYDGVLAFGASIAEVYRAHGWGRRAYVLHEAADTRLFRPPASPGPRDGLIWVGNWGDAERTGELESYLFRPARDAGLALDIHGVRYPRSALAMLEACGARYHGWIANVDVPAAFARHLATVHVPRRYYRDALPGIPTIRVFEALACGIPLVCAPWDDSEGLFEPGSDYLVAEDEDGMREAMRAVKSDADLRHALATNGLQAVHARHTCRHRAQELLGILCGLDASTHVGVH